MCLDILGNTGNIPTHRGPAALSPRWFACARLMTFVWTPIIHLHYRIGGRAWIPTRGRFFIAVSHADVVSVAVTRGRVTVRRFVYAVNRLRIRGGRGCVRTLWMRPCHIRNISGTPQVAPGWWLAWLQQCPVANGHVDTGPELTTRRSSPRLSAANSGCASVRVMLCDHARGGMTCDITTTAHTSGVIGACKYAHVSCTIRIVDGVSDKCRRGGR